VICNPTAILGPNDFERSRVGRVFTDLVNRRLPSLIDGGFDWVDVRDVAAGLIAAGEKGRTGESYLLSGRWASVRELAGIVESVTGISPPRVTSPMWLARIGAPFVVAYGRMVGREPLYTMEALRALRANRHIDNSKARSELGYAPRPLEQTVRDAIAWLAMDGAVPSDAVRDAGPDDRRAAS
jgi:dihydroflavonol-4-reductase